MQSRDACCEGVKQKDIQFVMVDSWDICGWRKWRFYFFSKYVQKMHQMHKPGSRTPGFVQMNLN